MVVIILHLDRMTTRHRNIHLEHREIRETLVTILRMSRYLVQEEYRIMQYSVQEEDLTSQYLVREEDLRQATVWR